MIWIRMLAYITGTVDQELLPRNFSVSQFVMQRPVPSERVGSPTAYAQRIDYVLRAVFH